MRADERGWGRFFRSALFPLIVIVLLVYLASQTLLENGGRADEEIPYSEAKALVTTQPRTISRVIFHPRSKKLEIELAAGRKLESRYPSDESALQFEQLLDANGVAYESRASGDSAWWSTLAYLLPFVLFFAFWIFMMNRTRGFRRRRTDADDELEPKG